MNLALALRYSQGATAFVGSGGKSTAIFQLARELSPAVVSTTTHLGAWQATQADRHITLTRDPSYVELGMPIGPGITLFSGPMQNDHLEPLDERALSRLLEICADRSRPLLIEADGSRQKPLKAPADHEPVIPAFVSTVVVVVGLSGLGKQLTDEFVHRPEIFSRLSGLELGKTITPEALIHVLSHAEGGLKNIPTHARRILLLNQCDTPALQAQAKQIAGKLIPPYHAILIASLNPQSSIPNQQSQIPDQKSLIHSVHEPVAGIILAAGGSSRFGQPKPLLDWHGQSFLHKVAETALAAGLSPVVVVIGANAPAVWSAVSDLRLTICHNPEWENGQSTSIQAGLRALPRETAAAIFLLADQPQIPATVLRTLREEHARTLAPIVAPLVRDRRANPVLFDRLTFHDLMRLEGDIGGRAIFSKYLVNYLPWQDESLLSDVDTPEDYRKLVNGE